MMEPKLPPLMAPMAPFDMVPYQVLVDLAENCTVARFTNHQFVWDQERDWVLLLFEGEITIINRTGLKSQQLMSIEAGQCINVKEIGRAGQVTSETCFLGKLSYGLLIERLTKYPEAAKVFRDEHERKMELLSHYNGHALQVRKHQAVMRTQASQASEFESKSRSISQDKLDEYYNIKENYRGLQHLVSKNAIDQQLQSKLSTQQPLVSKKRQAVGQLPFADLRLPGNFFTILQMSRNKRQQLLDIAQKYKLSNQQREILQTDQYYIRKKENAVKQRLQNSIDRIKSRMLPSDSTRNSKQSLLLGNKQTTQQSTEILVLPHLKRPQQIKTRLDSVISTMLQDIKADEFNAQFQSKTSMIYSRIRDKSTLKYAMHLKSVSPSPKVLMQSPKYKNQSVERIERLSELQSPIAKDDVTSRTLQENEVDAYLESLKQHPQKQQSSSTVKVFSSSTIKRPYQSMQRIGTRRLYVTILK